MNGKEQKGLSALVLAELEPTAERISALKILESGKVPARYAKTRDARGGRLTYIDHVWTASLLRDAFGHLWSFDVRKIELFEFTPLFRKNTKEVVFEYPKFASATCTLTVEVGGYKTSVTEVGAFDNTLKLNPAAAEASVVHRALVKCVMLAFGLGTEFYRGYQVHTASAGDLWANLLELGQEMGLTKDQTAAAIKAKGITKSTLVSRFDEARDAVGLAGLDPEQAPTEDPLVEAALELGGEVVGPDIPHTRGGEPVVDQETGEILDDVPKGDPIDWVKLYEWCGEHWDSRFGKFRASDAKAILADIFGDTELRQVGKQKIAAAFLEWMGSDSNEDREAIREKYQNV